MFGFPKRGQPEIRVDHVHADGTPIVPVTPAAVAAAELRRIDAELLRLSRLYRDPTTLSAIDAWLDRRLSIGRRRDVPVIPGRS